jgi:phage terminase large subunit-like protein
MRAAQADTLKELREAAEADLHTFAKLLQPHRVYGQVHEDVFRWWMQNEREGNNHTGLLLPRDHQKSHLAAVKAAWLITRDPSTTILYVSATAQLAKFQMRAIKSILLHPNYRRLWPNMINPDEGKREKWTETEICVDHPIRKEEGIRDSTVLACGITKTIAGVHVNHVFLDDLVVPQNAYTADGRAKVEALYSQLASIETTDSTETVVGTRYHPVDIYDQMINMKVPIYGDEDEIVGEEPLYNFKIEVVETDGVFLWTRQSREDGKEFGFNIRELSIKKAKYLDKTQFYAQYYQEPNDPESNRLDRSRFQYYDQRHLVRTYGSWTFKEKSLNVYASIDFAFSLNKQADYTAIVVVGIDGDGYIYVLDIDRFKADKINTYYERLIDLHGKWKFKKLRAEVNVAQQIIVNDLKDRIRAEGNSLSIDEHRPQRADGKKEERIAAVLEPRYDNMSILHFKGGYTSILEEELMLARPAHDDIKDALACAVEIAKAPRKSRDGSMETNVIQFHSRFGGTV